MNENENENERKWRMKEKDFQMKELPLPLKGHTTLHLVSNNEKNWNNKSFVFNKENKEKSSVPLMDK